VSALGSSPAIPRDDPTALVVTSIAAPNAALRSLALGARRRGARFVVVGDSKSPTDFELEGCEFYGLAAQRESGLRYAAVCPERSYARKNIGYLLAIRAGARVLIETDDDNFPRDAFWAERRRHVEVSHVDAVGWVNVYRYFTDTMKRSRASRHGLRTWRWQTWIARSNKGWQMRIPMWTQCTDWSVRCR
jgi:hypothetical protein